MNTLSEVQISSIVIKDRHRKDLGDIESLATSIDARGLLQPIVLASDGKTLVAGARRIEAFKHLNRDTIPAYVVESITELHDCLYAEQEENTCRKAFTISEAVAMSEAIGQAEKVLAEQRQRDAREHGSKGGRGKTLRANCPKGLQGEAGRAKTRTAAHVGMKRRTLEKAEAVIRSGDKDLIEFMDRTGNVSRPYEEVRRKVIAQSLFQNGGEPEPEPDKPFREGKGVIIANEAINCLIRIPKNDPLRKRGFQIVTDWIKAQR